MNNPKLLLDDSAVVDTVKKIVREISGRYPEDWHTMRELGIFIGRGKWGDIMVAMKEELGITLPAAACFSKNMSELQRAVVAKVSLERGA